MTKFPVVSLAAIALAACASQRTPARETATSVSRASDTQVSNGETLTNSTTANNQTRAILPGKSSSGQSATVGNTASAPPGSGGSARPAPTTATTAASSNSASSTSDPDRAGERAVAPTADRDNTKANERDKVSGGSLTPVDQGNSETDRKITQQIRQAIVKDKALSFDAKNVKIITIGGRVTLRGPVRDTTERSVIEASAKKVAGEDKVENLLEIEK